MFVTHPASGPRSTAARRGARCRRSWRCARAAAGRRCRPGCRRRPPAGCPACRRRCAAPRWTACPQWTASPARCSRRTGSTRGTIRKVKPTTCHAAAALCPLGVTPSIGSRVGLLPGGMDMRCSARDNQLLGPSNPKPENPKPHLAVGAGGRRLVGRDHGQRLVRRHHAGGGEGVVAAAGAALALPREPVGVRRLPLPPDGHRADLWCATAAASAPLHTGLCQAEGVTQHAALQ
jgi:hypothetical protein